MVLEKTTENPLDCKEDQTSQFLKEISPECSLEGLTLTEAETPILWPPHAKN